MNSVDVMGEVDIITSEQVAEQDQAEKEANLIPAGTWEGQIISWTKVPEEEKGEKNGFKGVPQYRVGFKFYDCPEVGKAKTGFFNMTPHKLLGEKGKPKLAYTTLVQLIKQLRMDGQLVTEALEQAKVTRLKYKVATFETTDGNTINFLKAIMMASLMMLMLVGCGVSFERETHGVSKGVDGQLYTHVEHEIGLHSYPVCNGSCDPHEKPSK